MECLGGEGLKGGEGKNNVGFDFDCKMGGTGPTPENGKVVFFRFSRSPLWFPFLPFPPLSLHFLSVPISIPPFPEREYSLPAHLLGALGLGLHSSCWTECNMTLLVVCGVLTA